MALTLAAAWMAEAESQSQQLIVYATIEVGGGTTFVLQSSTAQAGPRMPSIASITPVSPKIDPLTRAVQTSQVTVTCVEDKSIRDISALHRLKNKEITLEIGFSNSNKEPLWAGIIYDVIPGEGFIDIYCKDVLDFMENHDYYGQWINEHPLDFGQNLIEESNVPTANIDTTTFDPETDTGISHFVVSWWKPPVIVPDPVSEGAAYLAYIELQRDGGPSISTRDTMNELALLMTGSIFAAEDGKITFKRYDSTAASVADWTKDDIRSLKVISVFEPMINRVVAEFNYGGWFGDEFEMTRQFIREDLVAQGNFKIPGGSDWVREMQINIPLHQHYAELQGAITDSATSFVIEAGTAHGIAGTRVDDTFKEISGNPPLPFTQPTNAVISSSRPLWLLIDDEIIKCTATSLPTVDGYGYYTFQDIDGNGEALSTETYATAVVVIDTAVREQLGTTKVAHDDRSTVYDITMLKHLADTIVDRSANGLPIIEVETSLAQYAPQIGDLVTIDDDVFLWYGTKFDGLDSTTKWEVVGKQTDPLADDVKIVWTLAFSGTTSPPFTSAEDYVPSFNFGHDNVSFGGSVSRSGRNEETSRSWVESGLVITNPSGLNLSVSAGTAGFGNNTVHLQAAASINGLVASQDNYIGFDMNTGQLYVSTVANGAAAPTIPRDIILLSKVVTGPSSVLSIDDAIRNLSSQWLDTIRVDGFYAYLNANQTGVAKNVLTVLDFDTEDHDADSRYWFTRTTAVTVLQVDDTPSGTSFVNETTDFNDAGNADYTVFPATESLGDYACWGFGAEYDSITFDNANGTAGVGGVVLWEYWNGTAWASLSGVTDGTSGFTAAVSDDQEVTWTRPTDWKKRTISTSSDLYWVRARIITSVYSTNPIYDQGFIGGRGFIAPEDGEYDFTIGVKMDVVVNNSWVQSTLVTSGAVGSIDGVRQLNNTGGSTSVWCRDTFNEIPLLAGETALVSIEHNTANDVISGIANTYFTGTMRRLT